MLPEQRKPAQWGTLMLCHLQEPGNVGAVLRTAAAFGVQVVLTGDCPDPFSPKVLRASMGGVLGGRWCTIDTPEHHIAARKAAGTPVYAAALNADSRPPRELDLSNALILLGNEGAGLPQSLIELADGGWPSPCCPPPRVLMWRWPPPFWPTKW